MKLTNKQIGDLGERIAGEYIVKNNYILVENNWRCRIGEIDIIAKDLDILVFIEVKSRIKSSRYGLPIESIDKRKQKKIKDLANIYIFTSNNFNKKVRFDCVTVEWNNINLQPTVNLIKGAF